MRWNINGDRVLTLSADGVTYEPVTAGIWEQYKTLMFTNYPCCPTCLRNYGISQPVRYQPPVSVMARTIPIKNRLTEIGVFVTGSGDGPGFYSIISKSITCGYCSRGIVQFRTADMDAPPIFYSGFPTTEVLL